MSKIALNPSFADGAIKPLTITIATTCELSGLGATTIWKLIKERKLETVHVGRRTLVTFCSLETLLAPSSKLNPNSVSRALPRKREAKS